MTDYIFKSTEYIVIYGQNKVSPTFVCTSRRNTALFSFRSYPLGCGRFCDNHVHSLTISTLLYDEKDAFFPGKKIYIYGGGPIFLVLTIGAINI